jgi:Flp pilus assembly protein TadG
VVLETILALPIFVIMLMGLVEFGVLVENLQYVQAASRAGAMVASRMAAADIHANPGDLPGVILDAVNDELERMQVGALARQVRLQTNVTAAGAIVVPPPAFFVFTGGQSVAPDPYVAITAPAAPAGAYVRVTVFVDVPDVTPNVLATFGLDFKSEVVQQTATFPWAGP